MTRNEMIALYLAERPGVPVPLVLMDLNQSAQEIALLTHCLADTGTDGIVVWRTLDESEGLADPTDDAAAVDASEGDEDSLLPLIYHELIVDGAVLREVKRSDPRVYPMRRANWQAEVEQKAMKAQYRTGFFLPRRNLF